MQLKLKSYNFFSVLPPDAFVGMNELESLDLEHCGLRSIVLNDAASPNLENLLLEGNQLDCDCHARWLWNLARANNYNNNDNNNKNNKNNNDNNYNNKSSSNKNNNNSSRHLKTLKLPVCSTPFSVKNLKLENLEGNYNLNNYKKLNM